MQGFEPPLDDQLRLELLGHVLERYRHHLHFKPGRVNFEQFLQCSIFVDEDKIVVAPPKAFGKAGTGIAPIQYQVPLLNFLLAHHKERIRVIDIIDRFVEKVWKQLGLLDFKRTETGVTRCYTNIRFAANVLRGYGFLKFSEREAFKTWELSLPGFVVAAYMAQSRKVGESPWKIRERPRMGRLDLDQGILDAWEEIEDYDKFEWSLARICAPSSSVFETFHDVLESAHRLLNQYWQILRAGNNTQARRRSLSRDIIRKLEASGVNDKFYEELSSCISINDELDRVALGAKQRPAQGELL